jgi:hypothetical protein
MDIGELQRAALQLVAPSVNRVNLYQETFQS